MLSLGIDIGTTSICGIVVNALNGEVKRSITLNSPPFIKTNNTWEKIQKPDSILSSVIKIVDELLEDDVETIGITGQMHGILYSDKDGNCLSPLYTWQDDRGNQLYKASTYAKHFGYPSGYGLVTDFYNRENKLIPRKAVKISTVYDYIAMKLAGKKEPLLHSSSAASLGAYDIKENAFLLNKNMLSDVTTELKTVGYYKGRPICVGIGDNQASFIGSVRDENSVLINYGTGSQVSVFSNEFEDISGLETRPLYNDKYIIVGCALCGGRAFSALENFFAKALEMCNVHMDTLYPYIDKMLENSRDTDLNFSTRFCGTRENPDIRAEITNLSLENFNPLSLTTALLYGMVNEIYDMFKISGKECKTLVGSGNGLRKNKALQRIAENVFNSELYIPQRKEEAAYGAALCSMVSGKIYDDILTAQKLIKYESDVY